VPPLAPSMRGHWVVQCPQLTVPCAVGNLATDPDGDQWFFLVMAVFLREKSHPLNKGAGGSQRPLLALWDMSAPPSPHSAAQPLPCRPSGHSSFTQAGPIASRVWEKMPSNCDLSVCRVRLPQSEQMFPQLEDLWTSASWWGGRTR
jgi:hypothetical protein